MKKLLSLAVLGAAFTAPSAFATVFTFSSAATFTSSSVVGGSLTGTETFTGNTSTLFTFAANPFGLFTNNTRQSGVLQGSVVEVMTPLAGAPVTGGTLVGTLSGFGGDFDLNPAGLGGGLTAVVNFVGGTSQTFANIGGAASTFFWGVTSDATLIQSITIQGATAGNGETYSLDNVLIKGAVTGGGGGGGGVPEPSTFGLMGAAMIGLGLIRRLRF